MRGAEDAGERREERRRRRRETDPARPIAQSVKLPREEKEGPTLLLYQRGQGCCLPSIPAGPREDDYRNMFFFQNKNLLIFGCQKVAVAKQDNFIV